jgi:hypothetical protein
MEGLDPAPVQKTGTQLWLPINMVRAALPDYEQRMALYAGLIWTMARTEALGDLVNALTSAVRKRLAAELAKYPSGRAPDRDHTSESEEVVQAD